MLIDPLPYLIKKIWNRVICLVLRDLLDFKLACDESNNLGIFRKLFEILKPFDYESTATVLRGNRRYVMQLKSICTLLLWLNFSDILCSYALSVITSHCRLAFKMEPNGLLINLKVSFSSFWMFILVLCMLKILLTLALKLYDGFSFNWFLINHIVKIKENSYHTGRDKRVDL